jgi:hypothetical protein
LRKLASILLIIILLFNLGGYRIVISLLQHKADLKLEARIDNSEYQESQLIEIRVALNVPYQERYTEFERHYGKIEIDGKSYTYVKSKIEGDVLVLKCIPNESKQQLQSINNDWVKTTSGIDIDHASPGKSTQHNSNVAKNFWSEYDDQDSFLRMDSGNIITKKLSVTATLHIPEVALNTPHQPPESLGALC